MHSRNCRSLTMYQVAYNPALGNALVGVAESFTDIHDGVDYDDDEQRIKLKVNGTDEAMYATLDGLGE